MPLAQSAHVDPRADKVMSYWFGPDWQTQTTFATHGMSFKKWFMGGSTVDEASWIVHCLG
jgi:hypothetical protein